MLQARFSFVYSLLGIRKPEARDPRAMTGPPSPLHASVISWIHMNLSQHLDREYAMVITINRPVMEDLRTRVIPT
jgi:hypothetical protein